jgi:hypothetical protein
MADPDQSKNAAGDKDREMYRPVNEPIQPHSQVSAFIEILGFDEMLEKKEISRLQVFFEHVAQEIYNTRKKNYSWGFSVIEPEFLNLCEKIFLISKLYKEEELFDLNSVVFKLFTEFSNIILSTALHMHLPVRGIIRVGESYRGSVSSRKPALVSGKDPLILADLLKVFTIGEIFPDGFSEGLIPAVNIPYHFGDCMRKSLSELPAIDSIGIFMPSDDNLDKVADVTILSSMMVQTKVSGKDYYACNWKAWMNEHADYSPENILSYAEQESGNKSSPHSGKWKNLIEYSGKLP